MLNMLPKLALVAMKTYFSVLAKVARPSRTPSHQDAQVLLQQDDVGRLLGHVHRVVHRDADVGGVQGRGVVDPVAHVADDVAGLLQGQDDPLLLVRLHLGEDGDLAGPPEQRLVAHLPQVRPGEDLGASGSPAWPATWAATRRLSPVMIFERDAEVEEPLERRGDPGPERVVEDQEAEEGHVRLVALVDPGLGAQVPVGDPQGAQAPGR